MNRSAETAPVNSVMHTGNVITFTIPRDGMKDNAMGRVHRRVKNMEIMGKKIGTAAVPAVPKGSMESINFLGGPARVTSDRYEYEKALCVQV